MARTKRSDPHQPTFDQQLAYGSWRNSAKCLGEDTDLFFPDEHTNVGKRMVAVAREMCTGCPVQTECLLAAIELEGRGSRYGVWGATTAQQRERLVAASGRP